MGDPRLVRVEWAELQGSRPRAAGSNAPLGPHGAAVRVPLARPTLDDGTSGFGPALDGPTFTAAVRDRGFAVN